MLFKPPLGLVALQLVQVFYFLVDLLSSCSIPYGKWGIDVSNHCC